MTFRALLAYQLATLFDTKRCLFIGGIFLLCVMLFVMSTRFYDDTATQMAQGELYGEQYFIDGVFFLTFACKAFVLFTLASMGGVSSDIVLLNRVKRFKVFSARYAALCLSSLCLLFTLASALFMVHAFMPYAWMYRPDGTLLLYLSLFLVQSVNTGMLAHLIFNHVYAYLGVLAGFMAGAILIDFNASPSTVSAPAYLLEMVLPGVHPMEGGFSLIPTTTFVVCLIIGGFILNAFLYQWRDV